MYVFELKGGHVAAIFGVAFTIIISVNLTLAFNAVRTFPGLEVKNSYVASQSFDADRAAQLALGWTVSASVADGGLALRMDKADGPAVPKITHATLGRATHVGDDIALVFKHDGDAFRAKIGALAPGNWNLRVTALAADGTLFRQRIVIRVPQ